MERERITREELMERLFHDDYENLKGKKLRMTRVRVPGKEVCMAHIISRSDEVIYQNLGLHIELMKVRITQESLSDFCVLHRGKQLWLLQM